MSDTTDPPARNFVQKMIDGRFEEEFRDAQRMLMVQANATIAAVTESNPVEMNLARAFIANQVHSLDPTTILILSALLTQAFLITMGDLDVPVSGIDVDQGSKS